MIDESLKRSLNICIDIAIVFVFIVVRFSEAALGASSGPVRWCWLPTATTGRTHTIISIIMGAGFIDEKSVFFLLTAIFILKVSVQTSAWFAR